ncbi:ATPase, F1 complex, gamma subunit domain-containing protein [Dichotomocladium elegans]|nr:ATPase, F1 complex, gamma subunit domain-containing protein [Dichotomocladium elegans]
MLPNTSRISVCPVRQLHLRSVSNIEKITKSMKMVVSAKVKRDQRVMETDIIVSSDHSMCGESPEALWWFYIGDKLKAHVTRFAKQSIVLSFNQMGKEVPSFAEVSSIADLIKTGRVEFDTAKVNCNEFKLIIVYETNSISAFAEDAFKSSSLPNLQEFTLANSFSCRLVEGHASEMCAKRVAVENAVNNADDMINKLTMIFNRGRQRTIPTK